MKKRILALLFALLLLPCLSLGENGPERISVRIAVNGEIITPHGASGETVSVYIINGILYIPADVIPVAPGWEVSYDAETKTLCIDEAQKHGLCWVLTKTEHEVSKAGHDGKEVYTYKGVVNDRVRFTRSGGYYDDSKWGVCDGIYECRIPPASIVPGETISLTMRMEIDNYSWKGGSKSDINSVHVGTLFVNLDGVSFENADGEKELRIGTAAGKPYTGENAIREDVFHATMPDSQREGATAVIRFSCQSGTVAWTYELMNR